MLKIEFFVVKALQENMTENQQVPRETDGGDGETIQLKTPQV